MSTPTATTNITAVGTVKLTSFDDYIYTRYQKQIETSTISRNTKRYLRRKTNKQIKKSLRSRSKPSWDYRTAILIKPSSFFNQDYSIDTLHTILTSKRHSQTQFYLNQALYQQTDIGLSLLLDTPLPKSLIDIVREYYYARCSYCCDTQNVTFRNFLELELFDHPFCTDCIKRTICPYCNSDTDMFNHPCRDCMESTLPFY